MEKELNGLLQWKEKEEKELHACQFLCQNKMLQDVKKHLQDIHEEFNKWKEDFVCKIGTSISNLRVQLDKVKQTLVNFRNGCIGRQHEEYVNLKCHMERKIQNLEEELACQKQILQTSKDRCRSASDNEFLNLLEPKSCEKLAHAAKEKGAMPASVKEARVKQLQKLKQKIRELQMRRKGLENELYRREWNHSACLREKDALIRKCKQKLSLAAKRKWILEQSEMEAKPDWQQLCEDVECNWYHKSEDLTQSLSSAREQIEADLQKTDCRLHEVKTVLSASTVARERAIQTSFNHSILPKGEKQIFQYDDKSSLSNNIPTLEIRKLQEQNANLRAAITQMRKEMENLDEQMSAFCQREKGHLTEQGSLCTNKISAETNLSNIKVSSANLDYIVYPGTEKDPNPRVHDEKMVYFGQQLPDVDSGVGLQYGVRCTLQGMQNKLKEAARKISILSQEKQQLIELGNRLRAELGMVLQEGLGHPVSSKCCTVCFADSLFPRELVKRAECQLSALKQLQHRLTTQELPCAKQYSPSKLSSLMACLSLEEEAAPSSCRKGTELPPTEVQLDFSIESHGPEHQKADTSSKAVRSQTFRQSPSQDQQVHLSSPRACNFCQGTWQTLEMRSSPSILSPQKNTDQAVRFEVMHSAEQSEESQQNIKAKSKPKMPARDLTVRGTRLEFQQKLKSRNLSCAHRIKPKISSNMVKIRNYNIKD